MPVAHSYQIPNSATPFPGHLDGPSANAALLVVSWADSLSGCVYTVFVTGPLSWVVLMSAGIVLNRIITMGSCELHMIYPF